MKTASSAQAASATTLTAAFASYQQLSQKKIFVLNLRRLAETIFRNVPSGLGSRRKDFTISNSDLEKLVTEGVQWLIDRGLGWAEDAEHCEENGHMANANPDKVSNTAKNRGLTQIGTLGSGNHFLEIQKVDKIFNPKTAKAFGITHEGQVTVMIHCGSRGYGHQVCSDYLRVMEHAVQKYKISLPDRELACAPGNSSEAKDYIEAMACAVNYAFCKPTGNYALGPPEFPASLPQDPEKFGLKLVYDVAHNIAKVETHNIDGAQKKVWVHRKGATRAFPAGHPDVPDDYRSEGQPVLIPGSMGTSSWVLVGSQKAMDLTFGSTAHGAGRMMSRSAAKRQYLGWRHKDQPWRSEALWFVQRVLRCWLKKLTQRTRMWIWLLMLATKLGLPPKLQGLFH